MKKILIIIILSFSLGFYLGREQMKKEIKDGIKQSIEGILKSSGQLMKKSLNMSEKLIDTISKELDK